MNLDEYVVLRIPRKSKPIRSVTESAIPVLTTKKSMTASIFGATVSDDKPHAPDSFSDTVSVSSAALNKQERAELNDDPELLTAGVMPMTLHHPLHIQAVNGSSLAGTSWGLEAVGASDSPFKGRGITVAILDTGIDASHPAFRGIDLVEKDFTGQGNGDDNGHGTHVAGTVFGGVVNGYRTGVAPGIKRALIGKVLDATGGGTTRNISAAILWAIEEGANIISMSLGIDFPSMQARLVRDGYPAHVATSMALERYRENIVLFTRIGEMASAWALDAQPVVLLAAAGNESKRELNPDHEIAAAPPAAAGEIRAIGAVGRSEEGYFVAPFSNTNVEVTAPGMDIVSAAPGGLLKSMDGTSMATPHVAGVLALWGEKILLEQDSFDTENLWMNVKFRASRDNFRKPYDRLDVGKGLVRAPQD